MDSLVVERKTVGDIPIVREAGRVLDQFKSRCGFDSQGTTPPSTTRDKGVVYTNTGDVRQGIDEVDQFTVGNTDPVFKKDGWFAHDVH